MDHIKSLTNLRKNIQNYIMSFISEEELIVLSSAKNKGISTITIKYRLEVLITSYKYFKSLSVSGKVLALLQLINGKLAAVILNTIEIWDLNIEKCIMTLKGHNDRISSIIEIKEGIILSGSLDKLIKIWDLTTGNCIHTLDNNCSVYSLCKLQDGRIVSGSVRGSMKIWNLKKRKCEKIMKLPGGSAFIVNCMIQMSNGNLAFGGVGHLVEIWDLAIGKCILRLKVHKSTVNCVCEIGCGRIAVGDFHSIFIWDLNTCQCTKINGYTDNKSSLLKTRDGRLAYYASDNTLRLWDADTGKCMEVLKNYEEAVTMHETNIVIQLQNGMLCSSSVEGKITFWG